jgi:hypothetical protein
MPSQIGYYAQRIFVVPVGFNMTDDQFGNWLSLHRV